MVADHEIRRAVPEDATAATALVVEAYSKYVVKIGRPPLPMLEDYAGIIRSRVVWVLIDESRMAGVLVLKDRHDHLLLDNVAVSPAFQGKGLGKALLVYAEQRARERGYTEIRLYTNEAMVENIALYTRIGYRETHREQEDYRRVFMSKAL